MEKFYLLFIILIANEICSQPTNFTIKNYTVENGLPSNECHGIVQDSLGYIWIATDRGLVRWDGYDFKTYGLMEGLQDLSVLDLVEDYTGMLWLRTLKGELYTYHHHDDSIKSYSFNNILKDHNRKQIIRKFSISKDSSVVISNADNTITKVSNLGTVDTILSVNQTGLYAGYFIIVDDEIHMTLGGDYFKNIELEKTEYAIENSIYFNGKLIASQLLQNHLFQGPIYAETYGKDKYLLQNESNNYFIENGTLINSFQDKGIISDIEVCENEVIVVSKLNNQGVLIYDTVEHLKENNGQYLLKNVSATDVLIDRNGNFWISSLNNGIYLLEKSDVQIISYNYTKSVAVTNSNIISIELPDKLISRTKNDKILFESKLKGELREATYSNWYDRVFISGFNSYYLDGKTIKPINYFGRGNLITPTSSKRIRIIQNNIICLPFRSIIKYKNLRQLEIGASYDFHNIRLYDAIEFNDQTYLAAEDGLFITSNTVDLDTLNLVDEFSMRINDLDVIENYLLLATNDRGLLYWDGNEKYKIFDSSDGLISNSIELIKVINDTSMVIGTKRGVEVLNLKNRKIFLKKRYSVDNGLPSNEILDLDVSNDSIYIATSAGLASLSYNDEKAPLLKVLIEDWVFRNNLGMTKYFEYDDNNQTIKYKAIDFSQNGTILYRYKLNHNEWTTTTNTSVSYLSISPGEYLFEVQAKNIEGLWGESAYAEFIVKKAWWQTAWFYGLCSLVTLFVIVLIFRTRLLLILKQHQTREELRRLELSALRAQMNPHFIFNCLTSIQNYINQNDTTKAMSYLSKFARLVRQILNASAEEILLLADELEMIENYVALENLRFKGGFDFNISLDKKIDIYSLYIAPMLIQPLIENAIKHGFKNLHTQAKINIDIKKEKDYLLIEVVDNGIGINNKIDNRIHKSFGSSITANRLKLLSSDQNQLRFSIPNSGIGTKVEFKIPYSSRGETNKIR